MQADKCVVITSEEEEKKREKEQCVSMQLAEVTCFIRSFLFIFVFTSTFRVNSRRPRVFFLPKTWTCVFFLLSFSLSFSWRGMSQFSEKYYSTIDEICFVSSKKTCEKTTGAGHRDSSVFERRSLSQREEDPVLVSLFFEYDAYRGDDLTIQTKEMHCREVDASSTSHHHISFACPLTETILDTATIRDLLFSYFGLAKTHDSFSLDRTREGEKKADDTR